MREATADPKVSQTVATAVVSSAITCAAAMAFIFMTFQTKSDLSPRLDRIEDKIDRIAEDVAAIGAAPNRKER
jgi:hypothetical protein